MKKAPWYKSFLIYPAVAVALIGAIPQYIDKIQGLVRGLDNSEYSYAKKQASYWEREGHCLALDPIVIVGRTPESSIELRICSDMLLLVNRLSFDGNKRYRWIEISEPKSSSFIARDFMLPKVRPDSARMRETTVCYNIEAGQKVTHARRRSDGMCYLEEVDPLTGKSLIRQVSCASLKCK